MNRRLINFGAFLLGFCAIFALLTMTSYAQDAWPDRSYSQPKAETTIRAEVVKAPTPSFVFDLTNLSGDFAYLYGKGYASGKAVALMGVDLVNYRGGTAVLRLQSTLPGELNTSGVNYLGASIMVSIVKAIGSIPDTNWLVTTLNPSVGITGGYDSNSKGLAYGVMISLINIPF